MMLVNSLMVLYTTIKSTKASDEYIGKRVNEFIQYCQNNENVEIELNHSGLQGVLYNLDDIGIKNYVVKKDIAVENEGYFFKY